MKQIQGDCEAHGRRDARGDAHINDWCDSSQLPTYRLDQLLQDLTRVRVRTCEDDARCDTKLHPKGMRGELRRQCKGCTGNARGMHTCKSSCCAVLLLNSLLQHGEESHVLVVESSTTRAAYGHAKRLNVLSLSLSCPGQQAHRWTIGLRVSESDLRPCFFGINRTLWTVPAHAVPLSRY